MGNSVFTEEQFENIGIALGINVYYNRKLKHKHEKELPDKFYRNYYIYGHTVCGIPPIEPIWMNGICNYICKCSVGSLYYFSVNKDGVDVFKDQYKKQIIDTHINMKMSEQILDDLGVSRDEFLTIKRRIENGRHESQNSYELNSLHKF